MKKYDFLHVACQDGVNFISNLIIFFNSQLSNSLTIKHIWITNNRSLFEKVKDKCNIVFENSKETKLINKYGKLAHWIIVHGLHTNYLSILNIRLCLDKKIILRTWGHDLMKPQRHPTNIFKTIYRYFSFPFFIWKLKRFSAIGVANIVDILKVRKFLGTTIPIYEMHYSCDCNNEKNKIFRLNEIKKSKKQTNITKIMIGHSGFAFDNHISIINSLQRFYQENIELVVMLPYGELNYIEKVKAFVQSCDKLRCFVVDKRMEYFDYAEFLNSIDIAIFDMVDSSALGNVSILLYLGKKLVLNENGDLAKAFDYYKMPYLKTRDLSSISFSSFSEKVVYDSDILKKEFIPNYYKFDYSARKWKDFFDIYGNKQ